MSLPSLQAFLLDLGVYSGIAALHVFTALLFLYNTGSGQAAGLESLPLDDAWIHLVYARSVAEHLAFYYNPEVPEAGITSPLWAILVGFSYKLLSPWGIGLVATAKILGVILAIGVSFIVMRLARRFTGNRQLGILAAVIVALDPVYTFTQLSGMEASLFGFLALGAAAAFLARRLALTGVMLSLAVATRPEGIMLVALVFGALLLKLLWENEHLGAAIRNDLRQWLLAAGPPIFMVFLVASYYVSVNGTIYPNSYLVKHVEMGLAPYENMWRMAQGYLLNTSYFGGYGIIATALLLSVAFFRYFKANTFGSLPLILFPFALFYALSVTIQFGSDSWTILHRRYLDPMLPFVVVGIVVGLHHAWTSVNDWHASRQRKISLTNSKGSVILGLSKNRWWNIAVTLGFLTLLVGPFSWMALNWPRLVDNYSWNSRNVEEINVAMAYWVNENLPPDATLGVADGGALRFFGTHEIVDLSGLNTHTAIESPARLFETAERHQIDYLIGFRNIYFDSWPRGEEIFSLKTERNTILGGREMVVYQVDWLKEVKFADKSIPQTLDMSAFRLLDSLDVGNQVAEEAHIYSLSKPLGVVERAFHIKQTQDEKINIKDDARVSTGSEKFVARSERGRPLMLVKRYDAAVGGSVNVYVDGAFVGEWDLAPRQFVFGEDAFRISGDLIQSNTTELRFEFVSQPDTTLNSFYYWVYTTVSE